jgi:uncharacterized protein with von Willebrand factor type A (vWA) domain
VSPAPAQRVAAGLLDELAGFAEYARPRGLAVSSGDLIAAAAALDALTVDHPGALFHALRLAAVRRHEDLPLFERLFAEYWGDPPHAPAPRPRNELPRPVAGGVARPAGEDGEEAEDEASDSALYSAVDVLTHKDFSRYDEDDWRRAQGLMAQLQLAGPWRPSRRKRAHRVGAIDMRRTLRSSLRTAGEPLHRPRRRADVRQRELVLVCDVSGSMGSYARALLLFAHAAVAGRRNVEAFAFATRLTRLTRELAVRDPAAALRQASEVVLDWSGGTRVGESLAELTRSYGPALRGSVLVVASDGWDCGEPGLLAEEAARMRRLTHRIVWLNPLCHHPGYEPLTRGMSTVLPYVDHFLDCHDLASLRDLLALLNRLGMAGAVRAGGP